jgi:hypothetical protein
MTIFIVLGSAGVPDAVQRATKWSGAPLIRDRNRS